MQFVGSQQGLGMTHREYGVHRIDECVVMLLWLPSLVGIKPLLDISPAPQTSIGDEISRLWKVTGSALAFDQLADALAGPAPALGDVRLTYKVFGLHRAHSNARERALDIFYCRDDCASEVGSFPVKTHVRALVSLAGGSIRHRTVESFDL
jgi:hypothetical protein